MFRIVRYHIHSKRIPAEFRGFRIVQLSDLHGMVYGIHHKKLLKWIHRCRPDVIMMTGDMADETHHAIPRFLDLCRRLRKRYPIYYIAGNHEQRLKESKLAGLLAELKKLGVVVLENENCTITRGGASIKVYGLVTPVIYYKDPKVGYVWGIHFSEGDVEAALGKADPDMYNILLAHNPLYYPSYRKWGADLTLAGHMHGGVIRIPGLGGLLSPDMRLFPKYDVGRFKENGRHLIISSGLGNHILTRVFNPAELVVVTLG